LSLGVAGDECCRRHERDAMRDVLTDVLIKEKKED
jgi:hypothetical protein